jgi:heat shock protein HslJ
MKRLLPPFFLFTIICVFFSCQPKPVGGVIENSWWVLASAKQGNKAYTPVKGMTISLRFQADKLSGEAPCNNYFGTYAAEGVNLNISDLGATKRMCDEMDLENVYLGVLTKAKTFTATKSRLEIFSENGQLSFVPMPEENIKKIEYENGVGRLTSMFPPLEVEGTPHLFPILRVDNPGDYPYKGTLIDTAFYQFFDAESSGIWQETGGEVLAIGQYDDLFLCRVPGRYVSSDIALFRNVEGRLTRSETVAWAWCDEGWCNQQDAWLTDMNGDGRLDIVQHYTLTDDKGKIREERMTALVQDDAGNFVEEKSIRPDKRKFEMAKI